jgi:hypothetical protein
MLAMLLLSLDILCTTCAANNMKEQAGAAGGTRRLTPTARVSNFTLLCCSRGTTRLRIPISRM